MNREYDKDIALLDDRLNNLETIISYLEESNIKLNKLVADQEKKINSLEKRISKVTGHLEELFK